MTDKSNNGRPQQPGTEIDNDPLMELTRLFDLDDKDFAQGPDFDIPSINETPVAQEKADPVQSADDFDLSFLDSELENTIDQSLADTIQDSNFPFTSDDDLPFDLTEDAIEPAVENANIENPAQQQPDVPFDDFYDLPSPVSTTRSPSPLIEPISNDRPTPAAPMPPPQTPSAPASFFPDMQASAYQSRANEPTFEDELQDLLDNNPMPYADEHQQVEHNIDDTSNTYAEPIFAQATSIKDTLPDLPIDETPIVSPMDDLPIDPFYDEPQDLQPPSMPDTEATTIEGNDPFGFNQVFEETTNQSATPDVYMAQPQTPPPSPMESANYVVPEQPAQHIQQQQVNQPTEALFPDQSEDYAAQNPIDMSTPQESEASVVATLDEYTPVNNAVSADQPPIVDSYNFDDAVVTPSEHFEIPNVPYNESESVPEDQIYSQEFDEIFSVGQPVAPLQPNESEDLFYEETRQAAQAYAQTTQVQKPDQPYETQANANYINNDIDPESDFGWNGAAAAALAGSQTGRRRLVGGKTIAIAAVSLIIAVGGIASTLYLLNNPASTTPTVIQADRDPIKVEAEGSTQTNVPNQGQAVYNQATGTNQNNTQQDQLVDNSETPEDLTALNEPAPSTVDTPIEPTSIEAAIKSAEDQTVPTRIAPSITIDTKGNVVRDSRVKTAQNDDNLTVPEGSTPSNQSADTDNDVISNEIKNAPVEDLPQPAWATPQNNDAGSMQNTAAQPQPQSQTSTPAAQQAPQAQTPVAAPAPTAKPTQTAAQPANTTTPPPAGSYYVQIASNPSQELAQSAVTSAKSRYGAIIGNLPINVTAANIPNRGTYYRVRIQAGSREDATSLCERYKQAGGSCFVGR